LNLANNKKALANSISSVKAFLLSILTFKTVAGFLSARFYTPSILVEEIIL